jgi:hypothetical protein
MVMLAGKMWSEILFWSVAAVVMFCALTMVEYLMGLAITAATLIVTGAVASAVVELFRRYVGG